MVIDASKIDENFAFRITGNGVDTPSGTAVDIIDLVYFAFAQ